MIGLLKEERTVGVDKVLGTHDVSMKEGWYDVDILETTIEHGDSHTLASFADTV